MPTNYQMEVNEMSILRPSGFSEGGGLLDDVNATVKKARFEIFDYQGKGNAVPSCRFDLQLEDGSEVSQNWSCGKATDWQPSEDGKTLVAIGRATSLNRQSNVALLLESIVNSGFPEDRIGDDITIFEGMEAHFVRVPAPERKGLTKRTDAQGNVIEQTVLVADKIIKLPWEKKASAPKALAKAPASAPKKAPAAEGEDLTEVASAAVLEILAENPDGVAKAQLPALLFKKLASHPKKAQIMQVAFKGEFLSSGSWTYDKGKLSL